MTSAGTISTTTVETASETGTPLPPPDDDITVNSGVTVESTGGNVDFTSGDSIVIQAGATVKSDTGSINLVVRTAASGTQDAFQKIFMGSKSVFSGASAKASNGLVQQTVQSDPNAVGYVSQDFIQGTNAVSYQGVGCTLQAAKSGEYGGVRNFWMVTRGRPKGAVKAFISWVQHSRTANRIVGTHWVPLH